MTLSHSGTLPQILPAGIVATLSWAALCAAARTPGTRAPRLRLLGIGCLTALAGSLLQTPGADYFARWSVFERSLLYIALTGEAVRTVAIQRFVLSSRELTRRNAVLAGAVLSLGVVLLENIAADVTPKFDPAPSTP